MRLFLPSVISSLFFYYFFIFLFIFYLNSQLSSQCVSELAHATPELRARLILDPTKKWYFSKDWLHLWAIAFFHLVTHKQYHCECASVELYRYLKIIYLWLKSLALSVAVCNCGKFQVQKSEILATMEVFQICIKSYRRLNLLWIVDV